MRERENSTPNLEWHIPLERLSRLDISGFFSTFSIQRLADEMPGLSFVFRLPSQIPIDLALVKPLGDDEVLGMSFDVGKVSSHACHFFLLLYDWIGEYFLIFHNSEAQIEQIIHTTPVIRRWLLVSLFHKLPAIE